MEEVLLSDREKNQEEDVEVVPEIPTVSPQPAKRSSKLNKSQTSGNLNRPKNQSPFKIDVRLGRGFSIGSRNAQFPAITRARDIKMTSLPDLSQCNRVIGKGIEGVTLVEKDASMKAQVEALNALAQEVQKGGIQYGNELKVEVLDPVKVGAGKIMRIVYLVKLTTNMRQYSHLTYHRLHVRRTYSHFEDLYKKLQSSSDYSLPPFPKKDYLNRFSKTIIAERLEYFSLMMNEIAKEPGIHCLSCVIDFFDDSKVMSMKRDNFTLYKNDEARKRSNLVSTMNNTLALTMNNLKRSHSLHVLNRKLKKDKQ